MGSSLRREQRGILSGSAAGDGDPSQQQGKVCWSWWKCSSVLCRFVHPLDPSCLWGMISAPLISSAQATSPKSLGSTVIILLCRESYWVFSGVWGEPELLSNNCKMPVGARSALCGRTESTGSHFTAETTHLIHTAPSGVLGRDPLLVEHLGFFL